MSNEWRRVSRRFPCRICGKPDWCLYTGDDDSPTAVICARVESEKRCGEGGWLHKLRDDGPVWANWRRTLHVAARQLGPEPADLDFGKLAESAAASTSPDLLGRLAGGLGVSLDSLQRLAVGWIPDRRAWGFPMRNAAGEVVGIRLRLDGGRKLSIRGGREGLFLPTDLEADGRLLVCEGPTDCASLLDLGLSVVGRPSCTGGVKHVCELAKRLQPEEVVLVADADGPGQRGAGNLRSTLLPYVPRVKVITPPDGFKDARAWKLSGATADDVEALIQATPEKRLKIRVSPSNEKASFAPVG